MKNKIEILAPVGNYSSLEGAIDGGADSIYFGTSELNMRRGVQSVNFKLNELKNITKKAHSNSIKCYLTLNSIVLQNELSYVNNAITAAKNANIDAIICWDPAIIKKSLKAGLNVHISTQASVSNSETASFYRKYGATRIILARECSLQDISEIKKHVPIELEVFCHGAMCMAISGRCLASQILWKKSANRGECLQLCRRGFYIKDVDDENEIYVQCGRVLSAKDLCTIPFIEKILETGVDALKIEGRMRSADYVKTTVQIYKTAVNAYSNNTLTEKIKDELVTKLEKVYNRGFSSGFYLGLPTPDEISDVSGSASPIERLQIGIVHNYLTKKQVAIIKIWNNELSLNDEILFMGKTTGAVQVNVQSIQINNQDVSNAIKGDNVGIFIPQRVRKGDKVFKLINRNAK